MRKRLLTMTMPLMALAFILSSCLGSVKQEHQGSDELAYITTTGGIVDSRYAIVSYLGRAIAVTSDEIRGEAKETCAIISYKINLDKQVGSIYQAEYATVNERLEKASFEMKKPVLSEDMVETYVNNIQFPFYVNSNLLNDHWFASYKNILTRGQKVNVHFFYDADNQLDQPSGEEGLREEVGFKHHKIIIDVLFDLEEEEEIGTSTNQVTTHQAVPLGTIRKMFLGQIDSNPANGIQDDRKKAAILAIKFRLRKRDSSESAVTDVYVGSWGKINKDKGTYEYNGMPSYFMSHSLSGEDE